MVEKPIATAALRTVNNLSERQSEMGMDSQVAGCGPREQLQPAQIAAAEVVKVRQAVVQCRLGRRLYLRGQARIVYQLAARDPGQADAWGAMTPGGHEVRWLGRFAGASQIGPVPVLLGKMGALERMGAL